MKRISMGRYNRTALRRVYCVPITSCYVHGQICTSTPTVRLFPKCLLHNLLRVRGLGIQSRKVSLIFPFHFPLPRYTSPEGLLVDVNYAADDLGFRVDHNNDALPPAPPHSLAQILRAKQAFEKWVPAGWEG